MFQVTDKQTGKVHTVYAVSGLFFLVYDGEWLWISMDNCVPVGKEVSE